MRPVHLPIDERQDNPTMPALGLSTFGDVACKYCLHTCPCQWRGSRLLDAGGDMGAVMSLTENLRRCSSVSSTMTILSWSNLHIRTHVATARSFGNA